MQGFEEAFNKIKAATGISDIEELVGLGTETLDHSQT